MASGASQRDLLDLAVRGDRPALQRLLLGCHDRLVGMLAERIPARLRRVVAAEDLLQEVYIEACRRIGDFQPRGGDSFHHWLAGIAHHRLINAIKLQQAAKRGGDKVQMEIHLRRPSGSVAALIDEFARYDRTPSQSASGHESEQAVKAALAGLREDYRQAIELRYVHGLPVKDVAAAMDRTDRAVHMLCYRGLRELRAVLGETSDFFSKTE